MNNPDQMSDEELLMAVSSTGEGENKEAGDSLIILEVPLEEGKIEYDRLQLREPSFYDIWTASQVIGKRPTLASVYDSQIKLVSRVTNIPERVIKRLPVRVLDRSVDYLTSFEDARRSDVNLNEADLDLRPEKVVLFETPISCSTQDYREMKLREPTVTERRRFKTVEGGGSVQDSLNAELHLLEDVSGWNRAALLRLPISKFIEAVEYLTGFFIAGQPTGKQFP